MVRVLLMEDDRALGLQLAGDLRNAGHEIVLCASASEARAELWHWDFDLLIADMVVRKNGRPVADGGLGLISWVRHTSTTTVGLDHLPIIAMSGEQTGRGMDFLLPTAERLGADMLLEKPLDMLALLHAIIALTGSHGRQQPAL